MVKRFARLRRIERFKYRIGNRKPHYYWWVEVLKDDKYVRLEGTHLNIESALKEIQDNKLILASD